MLFNKITPGPLLYVILAFGGVIYLLGVENIREYVIQKRISVLKEDNIENQVKKQLLLNNLLRLKRDTINFVDQLKKVNSGVIDLPVDLPHYADNLNLSYKDTAAALDALRKSTFVLTEYRINIDDMYKDLSKGGDVQ
jgi:hypothetical protein